MSFVQAPVDKKISIDDEIILVVALNGVFHDEIIFFASRDLKKLAKSCLPLLGIELTTLTITGSKVECLSE